ncbi:MAG TPA: PA14 domain-containing protein, partial [Candidatus Dormibacteraeota bacterium]|nr:PA14 domain-containing protein [Candidatus Dormibacteraeota bacterium]
MHRALKPATALPWERRRLAGQNLLCLFVLLLALFPFLLPAADAIQLTNVASLRSLSRLESNRGRPFSLTGTVTMRDPDRNLFVIQDATGAMAIHPDAPCEVTPGNLVSLSADACAPYLVSFPDYPFRPAGSDIRTNFEAPSDWGNFHLSRLSGFLHPPKTGDYTFWIASDNSSELWLSSDEDPSKVRPIATVRAGLWVNQYEWSRYPFQRSDPIRLESGKAYYIEAFTEQLEQAEHLSVAWQGPGIKQSIPDSRYLTPWTNQQTAPDSGLLREYWTNYAQGGLASITGERRAESAISARGVHVRVLAENVWPQGPSLDLGAQLSSETNYRWVRGQGTLDFISLEHGQATLQVNSGQNRLFVRVATWQREMPAVTTNWQVQVEGVCEGAYAPGGPTMPGTIWVPSDENVRLFELSKTNTGTITPYPVAAAS